MEGQVLGNRYEVIEKIGGGGMAIVYKAKCRLLNRFVALKVLRPEFTNDEEFVKRFRIEAQSAASLSHPNVVSIYDVGSEGNVYYIVMEYVDGITLKDYISNKGALGWRESVNIAVQICSAIEHAHKNHIVHRDIKPHNILITKEGIAKVTDFGIARAVSASTITMVGSTIGSVHYFSPEQARGGYTDEKSDLYSLGIALYEMVTGRVPFDGDTPVSIALKHIQEEAEVPLNLEPGLPKAVNDIILKAIKKDKSNRYQTATEFLSDLYRALKEPNGNFVVIDNKTDGSPTRRIETVRGDTPEEGEMLMGESKTKADKIKNRRMLIIAVATAAVIIIPLFIFIVSNVFGPSDPVTGEDGYTIEDYVGKDYNDVRQTLEQHGIIVREKRKFDENSKNDTILEQSVDPGSRTIKKGEKSFIELTISNGPQMVKVPALKNEDYRIAETKITDLGLKTSILEEFSDTVGNGLVTKTDPPADTEVKAGSTVTIFKSKGPEKKAAKVPDLTGKTEMEVQKMLSDAKLVMGKITPAGISSKTAKVINQNPLPNADAKEGDAIDITFEEVKTPPATKEHSYRMDLTDPDAYGDKIKVLVEATYTSTGEKKTIINNEEKSKADDFPLTVKLPYSGKTVIKVNIQLDDKPYKETEIITSE